MIPSRCPIWFIEWNYHWDCCLPSKRGISSCLHHLLFGTKPSTSTIQCTHIFKVTFIRLFDLVTLGKAKPFLPQRAQWWKLLIEKPNCASTAKKGACLDIEILEGFIVEFFKIGSTHFWNFANHFSCTRTSKRFQTFHLLQNPESGSRSAIETISLTGPGQKCLLKSRLCVSPKNPYKYPSESDKT